MNLQGFVMVALFYWVVVVMFVPRGLGLLCLFSVGDT